MTPDATAPATSARRRILASAGTGKTFQLTSHFLALLFAGAPPERILATTFTRKAAGEILERALLRLARAATEDEALRELRDATGLSELDARRCRDALARVARDLHRFQVRTLDSFFVRVATLFGLELGLPPGWSIATDDEADAIRAEAVGRLLVDAPPDALVELLRGLQAKPAGRDVHETLVGLLGAGRVALLDAADGALEWLDVPDAPAPAAVDAALAALATFPLPTGRNGKPNGHWSVAMTSLLDLARERDWDGLAGNGLVRAVLAGKVDYHKHPIPEELAPLVAGVVHSHLARLDRRNRSMERLLADLSRHYEALLRERGKLRFEDVPALLDPRDGGPRLAPDDLWFRLDGQLDHLLLDEFQDTSAMQWRVLAPLASEIVATASDRSFFCVGDVKQCIYFWRQAEPRLLRALDDLLPGLGAPEPLTRSFRSSPVVLDAVDRVFGRLASLPVFGEAATGDLGDAVSRWSEDFAAHEAADPSRPGGVVMVEAPPVGAPGEAGHGAPDPLAVAAERVRAVLDAHPAATVGVLFRTNKPIPTMMHLLTREGIRASGEGGNLLTDSIATLHFLSLLVLADHPAHSRAAFAVATSPFGDAIGLGPGDWQDARRVGDASSGVRRRLAAEGYGAFAASLGPIVDAHYGDWDARRFRQLVELAEAWDEPDALRPSRFVAHVGTTRVEDPTASNVQCMTVHAAKGLEFDAVFLPELGGHLVQPPRELLTRRSGADGLLDAICIKPTQDVAAMSAPLAELFREGREHALEEGLSVLYVAMTRARHRLELIVPARVPGQPRASPARLLRQAFGVDDDGGRPVLWRHPDTDDASQWACDARPADAPRPRAPLAPGLGLRAAEAPRFPAPRTPSRAAVTAGGPRGPAAVRDVLRAPPAAALQHGTLVHRLVQEVEWLDDFAATDAELARLLEPLEGSATARRRAVAAFRAGLEAEEIAALLSRPRDGRSRRVLRERRFGVELPDGLGGTELWTGAIDRLVLCHADADGDAPCAAEVVDWKTDAVSRDDVDARLAHYRPQMDAYRRVVAVQTGLPADAIRAVLAFLVPGLVVRV